MVKYIKITTIKKPCSRCKGEGWTWEKFYHNQVKKCKCYLCTDGFIEIDKHEDVTELLSNSQYATMETLIDFSVYLTGHDKETIEQMYNDWRR